MDKINKRWGEGSIFRLGDAPIKSIQGISTGSLGLNTAIGIGGYPIGRLTEIYGANASGKTSLMLCAIANAQRNGGRCALIDAEHAFDATWAEIFGVDTDSLYVSQPSYAEQALQQCVDLVRSGLYQLVIIDSVSSMIPKAVLEGEVGDHTVALLARLMSQTMPKLLAPANKGNVAVIFVNQQRENINASPYSPKYFQPGGQALKFYTSLRIEVARIAKVKDGDEEIGHTIKAKVVKSKVAPPFKSAEFDILYHSGIESVGEIITMAVQKGIIKKGGSWFSYNGEQLGQGANAVKQLLEDNEELLGEIKAKVLSV